MNAVLNKLYQDEQALSAAIAEVKARAKKAGASSEDGIVRLEIIENIQNYFRQVAEREAGYFKGKPRAERIRAVSAALSYLSKEYDALLALPGYIAPLVWALESDSARHDWSEAEHHIRAFALHLKDHDNWLKAASAACDIPETGRPEGALERDLASAFADIFEDHTGTKATANRPSQGPQSDDRRTGSFVNFVDAIIEACPALSLLEVNWRRKLVDALDKRKEMLKDGYDFESDKAARASRRHRLAFRHGIEG